MNIQPRSPGSTSPGEIMSALSSTPSTKEHRVLGSFYKDGLDRGEKAAHIVDPENREEHLKRLAEAGIDVQKMMDTSQLEVVPWTDVYVRDHRFDQDAMLTAGEQLIKSG